MAMMIGSALLLMAAVPRAQTAASRPGSPVQGGAPGATSPLPPRDRPPQPQQPGAIGTASIRGRVIRADTGTPVPRATVFLVVQGPADSPTAMTDDRGTYEVSHLAAGRYTVRVSKTGFVTTAYGQRTSINTTGTTIELADQQALTGIDVSLPPGAVIEGRIYDEYGEPVAGAAVQTARRRYSNGERRLVPDAGATSITDDLGRFRLYGIAAGAHYVSATVNSPSAVNRPTLLVGTTGSPSPTFYPGTLSAAEALPVTVTAGQEVAGIAFQMSSAQLATIAVTVRSASGRPIGAGTIALAVNGSMRSSPLRPDGTFSFTNIAPGQYTVTARLSELKEVATMPVTLSGSDVALSLVSRPGSLIKGRFVFDGGTPPANVRPENLRVTIQGAENVTSPIFTSEPSKTNDDWTFELPGVVGSGVMRYSMAGATGAAQPSAWALKAVLHRGVDVTDTPMAFTTDVDDIEIVLTQRVNVITGTLSDAKGDPVRDATVVAFADDAQRWGPRSRYILSGRPNATGQFTIRGLPPGRYLVIGVNYLESGDEQDPEILETLRRKATSLTLAEGESKALDLKLSQD
jgi:hypothetical protein